jgi:hypothetical protein
MFRAGVLGSLALALVPASAARAATDEPGERADLALTSAAVNRFLATLLPVARRLPGDRAAHIRALDVTFTEARYCGAAGPDRGRLLAVVRTDARTGAGGAPAAPLLAGDADCRAKLADIAARAATEPERDRPGAGGAPAPARDADAAAVVELLVAWPRSHLRISLGEIAAGRQADAVAAALARAKAAGPVETVETAAIDLSTARGAAQPVDLSGAFLASGLTVTAVPAGASRAGGAPPDPASLGGGSDGLVAASYPLANRLLALFGQDGPWVLDVGGTPVEVRGLQIAGAAGRVTVQGQATSRDLQETVHLAVDASGDDLAVAQVRAEPQLEDCGAQSAFAAVGCRARNAARSAAASAAAAALSDRYRGQPLRSLAAPPATSADIGGRHISVRVTPTRIRATATGVAVEAKIDLDGR